MQLWNAYEKTGYYNYFIVYVYSLHLNVRIDLI